MHLLKRYLYQVILWLVVWSLLWIVADTNSRFLAANGAAIILQLVLLFGLIYYAVPLLLFRKKYILFFVTTIPVIIIAAFIASELGPVPPMERPPFPGPNRAPANIPSRFLIQLLMMTISCVTAILLETFIYAQQKEKSAALTNAELKESELKFLKMQINPHFLFNALNNIYALSVTNSGKTQESISNLSEMLRYVIYDCEQPQVPLRKELDYIVNYIGLFQLKSSKDFDISFVKKIEDDHVMVAPMLFVPYIENAFKHSGIEKGGNHHVHISLVQNSSQIEFSVENSLPETPGSLDSQGGIGLPNVKKRLELLYPEKHELDISKNTVFKVNLKLLLP